MAEVEARTLIEGRFGVLDFCFYHLHLAELTVKYKEEVEAEADKATPKEGEIHKPPLSPYRQAYEQETGKGKSGKGNRREKGKKRRKGSSQTGKQLSPEEVRAKAEDRFEYWIRLGSPLSERSQQYGLAFVVIFPKEVTNSRLHKLRTGHDQAVADYVDFCYPGLKEQISNLSCVLRGIVARGIPTKQLVIETIPSHNLSDHPFEELFQFSNDRNSSELGGSSSEKPSQMSKEAVNTPQTDTAVEPYHQRQADERVQGTIESVQDTQPESTSGNLQSFSPSTEIQNGSLSNPIIDYSESVHSSANNEQSDHHEEPHRHINYRSPPQDVDGPAQSQPSVKCGELDPQDYFIQDDDWRAQPPSGGCEGEYPLSTDGDLQRSDSSEAAFYDLESQIDYSP